jgi:hypothetical protein
MFPLSIHCNTNDEPSGFRQPILPRCMNSHCHRIATTNTLIKACGTSLPDWQLSMFGMPSSSCLLSRTRSGRVPYLRCPTVKVPLASGDICHIHVTTPPGSSRSVSLTPAPPKSTPEHLHRTPPNSGHLWSNPDNCLFIFLFSTCLGTRDILYPVNLSPWTL